MCGIVGYIGNKEALPIIIGGLQKLEYRGYDSAGVAVHTASGIKVKRALGKLEELRKAVSQNGQEFRGTLGIGHTRWATHGRPSENNAHPHSAGRVSLIHNGIIENYGVLREELKKKGCVFESDTDTEIAAHLLNFYLEKESLKPFEALKKLCSRIIGSYAFLAIDGQNPDRILVAKNSTPIIIGISDEEKFVASDIPAVLEHTRDVLILEDGDVAEVYKNRIYIENKDEEVNREVERITWDPVTAQKGGYKHFMLKEIFEQPGVIAETFRGRLNLEDEKITLPEMQLTSEQVKDIKRIIILGCGTAWHAALVTKFYIEKYAQIPCEVDYSSEYRYRDLVLDKSTMLLAISQSGETADTLAALEKAGANVRTAAICNCVGSSLARKAKNIVFTHAGPEISVASTKAFTTQLIAGYLMALFLGQKNGTINNGVVAEKIRDLITLPSAIDEALKVNSLIEDVSRDFRSASDFLYIGRGLCYPIALEGALKLKEISYIHAEGYPAGEMKHGPIALIDENMPVVVLLQKSTALYPKTLSNLREVESRGARLIAITDQDETGDLHDHTQALIKLPHISEDLSPVIFCIPLQLLSYHIAVLNGTDVDLPRNLAKSVTVE
jgi:glucosamine--fructose-6-phosphate aminotransferase (isomerizing)